MFAYLVQQIRMAEACFFCSCVREMFRIFR